MCICILKTKSGKIAADRLRQAYTANPDGCGLLKSSKLSKLYIYKGNFSFERFFGIFSLMNNIGYLAGNINNNIIMHFRTASSAGFGEKYCHPFFVNDDLAFVHNGNLFHFSSAFKDTDKKDEKTDTIRFNEQILQKLPSNFLAIKAIRERLENYCKDQNSKMIFMDSDGKATIINEESGEWKDGCWYSNRGMDNYSGYGYSGAYKYEEGDVRFKGGLPTVQMFTEESRKNWFKCKCCDGWYPNHKNKKFNTGDLCYGCVQYFNLKRYCHD